MSRLLIAIRGDLSQPQAAHVAGITQSKISRAENDKYPLSPEDADAYARALNATPADRRRLVALAAAFAEQHTTTRAALMRSGTAIQQRIGRLERESTLIRSWQPEIVIGTLQTPAYTAALVGEADEAWWESRRARVALLQEPGREWRQLMSEAALRWVLGSYRLMVEQAEHLGALIESVPNLQLGIMPLNVVHPVAAPSPFHLFGERAVEVANATSTAVLTQPADVAHYGRAFDEIAERAVYGDEARALLARIADEYRAML